MQDNFTENEILLSIVIPVYNVEKYLEKCVNSVSAYDSSEIEIILVDDGSPDKSGEICDRLASNDKRIKVIHKQNEGVGFARNSGLKIARGKYVGFVDSDDYVNKDWFMLLLDTALKSDASAVFGGIAKENSVKEHSPDVIYENGDITSKFLPAMLGGDRFNRNYFGMAVWRGIYKKSIIDSGIRFPSEREYISEDAVFNILFMSKAEKIIITDVAGYHYCKHGESLTTKFMPDRFARYKKLFLYERELIRGLFGEKELTERLCSMLLGNIRVTIKQDAVFLPFCKALCRTKSYLRDECLSEVLSRYDYSRLPKRQKISCFLMKHRFALLTLLAAKLQNKSEKGRSAKR